MIPPLPELLRMVAQLEPSTVTFETLSVNADVVRYAPHGKRSVLPPVRVAIAALIAAVSSFVPLPVAPKFVTLTVRPVPGGLIVTAADADLVGSA